MCFGLGGFLMATSLLKMADVLSAVPKCKKAFLLVEKILDKLHSDISCSAVVMSSVLM